MFGASTTTPGATAPAATGQFSLGAGDPGAARTTQPQTTFSLGGAPKFSLGATSTPTTQPQQTFSLGGGGGGVPKLALTAASTPPTQLQPNFSLGGGGGGAPKLALSAASTPTTQPQSTFALGGAPKFSVTATSTSTYITPATTAATSISGWSTSIGPESAVAFAQPTAGSSFTVPSTTFATPSTTFSTPSTTTASFAAASSTFAPPTTTFTTALTSTSALAAVAAAAPTTAGQTSLETSTSVTNSSAVSASSLNFCQLEEAINKWTLELEEQEKLFMNQASQVNAWDRLLIANGEKIINLNNAVEQVKLEQQQLDHELDFILAQQRELEDLLTPLEKELETNSVSDPEREHTYQLAENLDTQLKQMSEDLKEIVEHINETNRSQDNTDPIVQIGRILNAHMNSLQWIDQNTTLIGSHLDQVAKLHEVHRRENERSFRLTYD